MKTLVVDSSVIVKWLNKDGEKHTENADRILDDVRSGTVELIAPEFAKYEVGNVLLRGKGLTWNEAAVLLSTFYSIPIAFVGESGIIAEETYELAEEAGSTLL